MIRVEITSVTDKGGLQLVSGRTIAGEAIKDAVRVQGHGLSTNPPAGSVGIVAFMGGRRDMPMLIGIEHPDKRPKSQISGGATLYDASGNALSTSKDGGSWTHSGTITIKAAKIVLEGEVHLGGAGGKLVHRKDDLDSDGDSAVGAATKVYAV